MVTVSNPIGIKRTVLFIQQVDTKKMMFACCACSPANCFTEEKNKYKLIYRSKNFSDTVCFAFCGWSRFNFNASLGQTSNRERDITF